MSSILRNCPILKINQNELQNLICFISKHGEILKEFGAIKIQLNDDCKLALKKRKKTIELNPIMDEIIKINKNEDIYFVKKNSNINKSIKENCIIKDESDFWSRLSHLNDQGQQLNTSLLLNKSFFATKTSRQYFDISRLPKQSINKIGGKKLTEQFVPYVKRAHGIGSIFPLNSTSNNLFSINYHHEGGNVHWYIIPNHQKEALSKIVNQNNICFDHVQLFISPSVLEKHNIIYYKITQSPNEFVVLSPGTLSQCFTEDSCWSESIDFVLPNWIKDDHINKSSLSCQCNHYLSSEYNLLLFKDEYIRKCMRSHLNLINNHQFISPEDSVNMDIPTPSDSDIESNSLNDESTITTNLKMNIPLEEIVPLFQLLPTSILTPPTDNYFFSEDEINSDMDYLQIENELLEEENFCNLLDDQTSDMTLIDSILNEDLFQSNMLINQTNDNISINIDQYLANIEQYLINDFDIDNHSFFCDEMTDLSPLDIDSLLSTYEEQPIQNIDTISSSNTSITTVNNQIYVDQEPTYDLTTLFVSGLRMNVNKRDIYKHFIGCIRVTIKPCHSRSHLKYAFVVHRTSQEAGWNLRRPVNFSLLGPECCVQYAHKSSTLSNNYQNCDNKKIVVKRIPENVTENDLQRLFFNGHTVTYSPARIIHSTTTTMESKNKILPGYAFILYDNEQEAANVIKHADQYYINGQSLVISLFQYKNHHL